MRVLHVSGEVGPYSKTGGLGEVVGALPAAQRKIGIEARVITPRYGFIDPAKLEVERPEHVVRLGGITYHARILVSPQSGVMFVDVPGLLDRPVAYGDYADNPLRFAVLCKVAADLAHEWDLLHLHDWQAGLTAVYLERGTPSVCTIHNLAYQGVYDFGWVDVLGIPPAMRTFEGVEFHGRMSLLKAGLVAADRITTVSPRYAREIQEEPGGHGLAGLLRHRAGRVAGIINGIDTDAWDPGREAGLAAPYSADDLSGKAACKAALQATSGVAPSSGPVLGVVARATWQKGFDLILGAAPMLAGRSAQLVVLCDGDRPLVEQMLALARQHPRQVSVTAGFDEALSRRIYAGADFILVPSRFEPCGLTQMIGMRYGGVPVVRETGGLSDTVTDGETGVTFFDPTPSALAGALDRAMQLYADAGRYAKIQQAGMRRDWSWQGPAEGYRKLYEGLLQERR